MRSSYYDKKRRRAIKAILNGLKADTVIIRMRKNMDVPKFLKDFDELQEASKLKGKT